MEISVRSILLAVLVLWSLQFQAPLGEQVPSFGPLVTKESRRTIVSTESGVITAVDVHDRYKGAYHLEFFTLDTSSLFLPVILHTDMVVYVQTGRGAVNWIAEDDTRTNRIEVKRGDIYRLEEGTIFYVQSHPDPTREKLRIHAIFDTMLEENPSEPVVGAYSNISDLVRAFDDEVLQMAFGVSEEVIQGMKWVERPPPIVHFEPKNETDEMDWREGIFEALIGGRHQISIANAKKKKEKIKTLNLYERKPDVENCNGRSTVVTGREFRPLRGSNIGIFMVNLTRGSMMGPHWNPRAMEIAVVTHGQGMVQVVCPSSPSGVTSEGFYCQNTKFKVNQGDIFIVPRYHPMAQISFNNDSLVFVGFTTTVKQNHPQFLAGKRSIFRTIDREILAISFNTANTTIGHLLDSQIESIMFECTSCAEDLERKMEKEIERKRQEEEARKREEEEARREEEEARRREEERRKREEEEARRREEEEARKRKEEEEARRREEEEEARKREEEARRSEEEEEAERRREEEEARRREEEEEARKREEKARREEEEEEARRREEEEAERRREEEEARRREEEQEARRREEEEEERRRGEEETRREEEEEQRRQEEEARTREEATRREEEARREEEEARRREEERREEEGEETRRREEEEEEVRRQEEEEEARRGAEETRRREAEEEEARRREEEAGREEEETTMKREEQQKQSETGEEEQARSEEEKQGGEEPAIRKIKEEKKLVRKMRV